MPTHSQPTVACIRPKTCTSRNPRLTSQKAPHLRLPFNLRSPSVSDRVGSVQESPATPAPLQAESHSPADFGSGLASTSDQTRFHSFRRHPCCSRNDRHVLVGPRTHLYQVLMEGFVRFHAIIPQVDRTNRNQHSAPPLDSPTGSTPHPLKLH